jgi:hypothetical protein
MEVVFPAKKQTIVEFAYFSKGNYAKINRPAPELRPAKGGVEVG